MEYEIERESMVNLNPPEAIERIKKGLCPICGKDKSQFHPRMRNYCSPEHREKYQKNIINWQEFSKTILERDKYTCVECGYCQKTENERYETEKKRIIMELGRKYPTEVEELRAEKLEQSEHLYQEAMNDELLMDRIGSRHFYRESNLKHKSLEVDHIIAIVNGGEMWDEKNLRTLCNDCHSKKTAKDIKKNSLAKKKQEKLGED